MSDAPQDFSDMLNQHRGGWNQAMGLRFLRASADEVVAELEVGDIHRQPYGIVHGGVHAGVIETLASTGAALSAGARGQSVVGLDNSTTFIRAIRDGTVRATARPLTRGRRTQVWETTIVDAAGRLVATGRVRLLCLDPGAELAGEPAGLKT
jgi:1,4-dihydroxy-2-naphthoyl-CoA hydrolase